MVIPRWFYRDLGLLEGAIQVAPAGLVEVGGWNRLPLVRAAGGRLRVGDLEYEIEGDVLDLGTFVRQPLLWVGNPSLAAFGPCKVGWDAPMANARQQVRLPDRRPEEVWPLVAGAAPEPSCTRSTRCASRRCSAPNRARWTRWTGWRSACRTRATAWAA